MPRAPKPRQLNTRHCPECDTLVKYKNDIARHMKKHAENREELMVHCTYPGCDYKSLQKSNVVNHTRRHGFSKSYACPFPNCTYFTLYSRFLTEHMLDIHGYIRSPRCKASKRSAQKPRACSSTGSSELGLGPFRQGADEGDQLYTPDLGLTCSSNLSGQQQSIQPVPAQLVPGYWHVPFYRNQFPNPPVALGDTRPARYCHGAVNGAPVPSHAPVPSQMPPAQFLASAHDQLQMPIQQQAVMPIPHTFDFEGAASDPLSFSSSTSSFSLSDGGIDVLAEIQRPLTPLSIEDLRLDDFHSAGYSTSLSSAGPSTAWENLSLTSAIMTSCAPGGSVPYVGETSIMPTSIDFDSIFPIHNLSSLYL